MDTFAKRPNRLPWPPLIYAAAILLAVISPVFLPSPWPDSPFSDFLTGIGIVMVLVAIFIDVKAMQTLHKHHTTVMPNKAAEHLVSSGPYSFSRNPIYLGNTMLTIGAGLASGIIWFVPLAFIAAFLTQKLAIEREEQHLAAKFGKAWRDYSRKVRRWF